MSASDDFLEELIAEGTCEDPAFAQLVDAAADRRELLRSFGRLRESLGVSQHAVAQRLNTQQPAVARLERGESNPKLSTLERYAAAIGLKLEIRLVDRSATPEREPVPASAHDPGPKAVLASHSPSG